MLDELVIEYLSLSDKMRDDWIEMLSIENDDFSIKIGDAISFSVSYDCVGIYPYFI